VGGSDRSSNLTKRIVEMNNLTESDPRTYAIIGAAMEVHRRLGCGFLEPVYQEAFTLELISRQIPFTSELRFRIEYKQSLLNKYYRPDFVCFESVILELKALARLTRLEESQLINCLKITGYKTGLLLNFGSLSLARRRFVL
jgi:GxxExxY protein